MKICKKNFLVLFILIVLLIIAFVSCSKEQPIDIFQIVYHSNGGESINSVSIKQTDLENFEISYPQKEGYSFGGWYFDNNYNEEYNKAKLVPGINELYAKWESNLYTIIIHNGDDSFEYHYNYGEIIRLNTVERDGFTFDGYYVNQELTDAFNLVTMPANDFELYPKFTRNPIFYSINYTVDESQGYLIGLSTQHIVENTNTTPVEVKPLDGYRFVGWDDGLKDPQRSDSAICDATYVALFEKVYTLTILNSTPDYGHLDGETIQVLSEGETSSIIKAVPNLGYKFKSWSNDNTKDSVQLSIKEDTTLYANFAIDYLELPVMEIYTNDRAPIESKEDYIKCKVSLSNSEYKYTFDSISGKIRGRGNTTWTMAKKPFKLKFDEKIDLFGNGSAKIWTLIANYSDQSMIRNSLAYALGEFVNADYTTKTQFIDLYLNGEHLGVYLVCEQNETGKTRVNIDESLENVNTGYLIELDSRASSEGVLDKDYFVLNDFTYAIKSPDVDDSLFSYEHVEYIKTYLKNAYDAIVTKNDVLIDELVDTDSFVRTYIVHELFNMLDVGYSSFYLYKDKDGKLKSGPIWDFDISSGNCDYYDIGYTKLIAAKGKNPWYKKLCLVPSFINKIVTMLSDNYVGLVNEINEYCDNIYTLTNAFNRNFEKWKILGKYVWPNAKEISKINTWEGHVEYLREWLLKSLDYVYNYYVDCEAEAYGVTFANDENASVLVYNTDDYKSSVIVLDKAWSRDLSTGELSNDGTGGIAFKVCVIDGYTIDAIKVDNPALCGEIVLIDEENLIYQINNIMGDIEISITTKDADASESEDQGYSISFNTDLHATIMVYASSDYSQDGTITNDWALSDISGDGQVNFKVILDDDYLVDQITVSGSYKNLKDPSNTGAENVYRITKVASNLIISITTKQA